MTDTSGSTTLVESNNPPRPTSITAYSTVCILKYKNAVAVNNSNCVGYSMPFFVSVSTTLRTLSNASANASSLIIASLIIIRSV